MAGPLSFGVSLIVQRVLTMPLRSRRMVLEALESRQLLSVSPTTAEVSVLAKSKQFTVVGTLTGSLTITPGHPGESLVATGDVGKLGTVQLQGTDPKGTHKGVVFTFTSAQGTLTFTSTYSSKPGVHNGYTLKLKKRTGAYAGWTGTGKLKITAPPGPAPVVGPGQPVPVVVPLRLTLKA